ncbi:MAG: hypothetical protein Q8T08_03805 [Ignavibacteria bacterium]|nr:hypothetical protein [Ignavibacteria bacterium]
MTVTAQATLSKFEICNGFTLESPGIYMTPSIVYSPIEAQIVVTGKFFNDIECKLLEKTYPLIEVGGSIPIERKLIYSFYN